MVRNNGLLKRNVSFIAGIAVIVGLLGVAVHIGERIAHVEECDSRQDGDITRIDEQGTQQCQLSQIVMAGIKSDVRHVRDKVEHIDKTLQTQAAVQQQILAELRVINGH